MYTNTLELKNMSQYVWHVLIPASHLFLTFLLAVYCDFKLATYYISIIHHRNHDNVGKQVSAMFH